MGLLKRLKKLAGDEQPKDDYPVYGEFAQNMDDAYRHGGYDKEEEANAREIRRVLRSENPPMSKATAAEKLARLEELRNMRIITEAEFERIRQEIRGDTNAKREKM